MAGSFLVNDKSKSCKYDDVYVCTIFNIDLPKNTVYTQKDGYLYVDSTKKLCDVETLRIVDARIDQLNKIIDGAE